MLAGRLRPRWFQLHLLTENCCSPKETERVKRRLAARHPHSAELQMRLLPDAIEERRRQIQHRRDRILRFKIGVPIRRALSSGQFRVFGTLASGKIMEIDARTLATPYKMDIENGIISLRGGGPTWYGVTAELVDMESSTPPPTAPLASRPMPTAAAARKWMHRPVGASPDEPAASPGAQAERRQVVTETEGTGEPHPEPERYLGLSEAICCLRPILFGADTEEPLSRMERELLKAGRPGLGNNHSSMLPGRIKYMCGDFEMFPNTPRVVAYEAAQAREHLLKVQNNACEEWLNARRLLTDLPDGHTVVTERALVAAIARLPQRTRALPLASDPPTSPLAEAPPEGATPIPAKGRSLAPRGKSNGLDYRDEDVPLVAKMREMIEAGKASSAENAARAVVNRAAGAGKPESKVKRLALHYRQSYPAQP
jgi:hypothetical protein